MFDQKSIVSVFSGMTYQIGRENLIFRKIRYTDLDLIGELSHIIVKFTQNDDGDEMGRSLKLQKCTTIMMAIVYLALEKPKKILPRPICGNDGSYTTQALLDYAYSCVGYFASLMESEGIDPYDGMGSMMETLFTRFVDVLSTEKQ